MKPSFPARCRRAVVCDSTIVPRWLVLGIAVTIGAAFIGGCSVPELPDGLIKENEDWLRKETRSGKQPSTPLVVPAQVQDALFELDDTTSSNVVAAKINVSVESLSAREFFFGVVGGSGANVVVHPEVTGSISLQLQDVTLQHVLDIVQDLYGYEYKFNDGTYSIFPATLRSELFELNYPDIQRVGVTDTTVAGGEADSGGASNSAATTGDNTANLLGYLSGTEAGGTSGLRPGTRIQTLNSTDLWGSLRKSLVTLIGGEIEGRAVVMNSQSGVIVVKAFPRELGLVRRFLKVSEGSLVRQVVLETKIVEVELTKTNDAGINWGSIASRLSLLSTSESAENTGLSSFLLDSATTRNNLFTFVLDGIDIAQLVDLLKEQGTVRVLSSPRISTVNNQKAVIRVGADEFFVTGIENTTTTTGSAVTASPDIKLTPFFSGISLDVTPQISDDGEIILHVHPVISEVRDQSKELIVGNSKFSFPLALREVRESDSVVRAKSGQLVVLGGLIQEAKRERQSDRSPFSELLPLNFFFRNQSVTSSRTELVILMKPQILTRSFPEKY
jgi:MSHA biogenesis protein MshL